MLLLFLLFIPLCLLENNVETLSIVFSILLIADITIHYRQENKISYLDVWNLAFLYMVCSEMILSSNVFSEQQYGMEAVRYIFIAEILFILGYKIWPMIFKKRGLLHFFKKKNESFGRAGRKMMYFLLALAIFYFVFTIQHAFTVFLVGRHAFLSDTVGGHANLLPKLMTGISYFVPIAAAFYCRYHLQYKQKSLLIIIIFLCSVPIALLGTRYRLLFTLVAPLIVLFDYKKLSPKLLLGIFIALGTIVIGTGFIKEDRSLGGYTNNSDFQNMAKKVASFGSNENIVRRANELFDYINNNELHYGKESAFILYFWVPRSIWPQKPTKIGHWLVNKYEIVPDIFSAAYGFWGQLLVDFGYFPSLIILFILGGMVRRCDQLKDWHLANKSGFSILFIGLFPVMFFSVRSPQTALINFILFSVVYFVLNYFSKKMGLLKKKNSVLVLENY